MRSLMAIVLFAAAVLALHALPADAARKDKRIAKPHHYTGQQRRTERERLECERARQEDPTGQYAAFPCWAQESFGRGNRAWD
jgi:hypothetical protein